MNYKVKTPAGDFEVDLTNDYYGEGFWSNLERGLWEPDTISFLSQRVDNEVDFIDIGAANGSISLVAASHGARVLAFEVEELIFNVARRNFELNRHLNGEIEIKNIAISKKNEVMSYSKNSDPKIVSSIMFGSGSGSGSQLEVQSLLDVVNNFHKSERSLIVKIDIEGAEWNILNDLETLKVLKNHKATVLLAIHPGFHRPYRKLFLGMTVLSKTFWQIRNVLEAYKFFKSIMAYANIYRTNLDPIKHPKKCVLLMLGGYFEFILEFGNHERL